jgi:predicted Co/Zn/Cd cation transporter (cation efflux family)
MVTEKKEKLILKMSFFSGLLFAVLEFIFAIYSHSQSSLTDAVYDTAELVFIALLLFLTPLFHKPISEKRPFGYFQIETIFIIIKGIMMLSVTLGVSAEVLHSVISGGNAVDNGLVSIFQCFLGIASIIIFIAMKRLSSNLSSPTIKAELLGWKLDIAYSLGMSFAFFISLYLEKTPFYFLSPYFDQIVAVIIMVFMLPESIKVLWRAIKDIFLFSPGKELVEKIKILCNPIMEQYHFKPVFYDITKTGRHLWIAVYFQIETDVLAMKDLATALKSVNEVVTAEFEECSCELIPEPFPR